MKYQDVASAIENLYALKAQIEQYGATVEIAIVMKHDGNSVALGVKPGLDWQETAASWIEKAHSLLMGDEDYDEYDPDEDYPDDEDPDDPIFPDWSEPYRTEDHPANLTTPQDPDVSDIPF